MNIRVGDVYRIREDVEFNRDGDVSDMYEWRGHKVKVLSNNIYINKCCLENVELGFRGIKKWWFHNDVLESAYDDIPLEEL